MILSRITQALRQQNWVAVALELVIVVLGVFIGMQVSNWNAMQAEKRLGHAYTERLRQDLQKDLDAHRAIIVYYTSVRESVEQANLLLQEPDADPRQLVMHAYRASEIVNAPRTGATWEEVVSSGDTGLLPRAALDSGLADFYAGDSMRDVYERMRESAYRSLVRATIPLEVQQAIRAGCSDVVIGSTTEIRFVEGCQIAVDERALRATVAALRAEPKLIPELRSQYSNVVSSLGVLNASVQYLEQALGALGSGAGPGSDSAR
jgi:hypothetical protein